MSTVRSCANAAKFAGPCDAMASVFKRVKQHHQDVAVSQAQTDNIDDLQEYRDKSCPTFLFYHVYHCNPEWRFS